jgi:RHS repeat-associated protein
MAVTNFCWDDQNLLQEYGDVGATIANYVTEPSKYGSVISQRSNGEMHYSHCDAVGSITQLTDQDGDVSDSFDYSAFGVALGRIGITSLRFTFVGQRGYYYDDELARYYVRRRVFIPGTGRWMSNDSEDSHRSSLYPYIYASNSPKSQVDPSGMQLAPAVQALCVAGPVVYLYGNYCGVWRSGPGAPLDCVDAACQRHDAALPLCSFLNPFVRKVAHAVLCADVLACGAPGGGCSTLPTLSARLWCAQAAAAVGEFACACATPAGY